MHPIPETKGTCNAYPFGLSRRSLETLYHILSKYADIQKVYIFGSRVKGNFRPGSDIDLAVMNQGLAPKTIAKVLDDCTESSLPVMVDLVDFSRLKHPDFIEHIERVGQQFYPPPQRDEI
jgi:predicted nucleotidyltransferase